MLSLQALCGLRARDEELIEKNLQCMSENMLQYRSHYNGIANALFRVGYSSPTLDEYLGRVLRQWKLSLAEFSSTLVLIAISQQPESQLQLIAVANAKLAEQKAMLNSTPQGHFQLHLNLGALFYKRLHQN